MTPLFLALLLQAPAAPLVDAKAWAGSWKSDDAEVYVTVDIAEVGPDGLTIAWDENVGLNSTREQGRAAWSVPGREARFDSERCALTLKRASGDRLEALVDEDSCFTWASYDRLTFVRADAVVHARTSFDCAKASSAVEKALCADRDLASADRRLAAAYKATVKRAGAAKDALVASQREWVARRDRDCGAPAQPSGCLMAAYGRRLLALRAWPKAPFDGSGRPDVDVLATVLADDKTRDESGVRELTAGLVGGIPDEMTLALHRDREGIWLSGCDYSDRSRGYDPLGGVCGRQHYVAFLRNGETWAAWADADGVKIVPEPRRGQKLPPSLVAFREDPVPADVDR